MLRMSFDPLLSNHESTLKWLLLQIGGVAPSEPAFTGTTLPDRVATDGRVRDNLLGRLIPRCNLGLKPFLWIRRSAPDSSFTSNEHF